MQVNNRNYTSPNFGMAMKIKPEALEDLKGAPRAILSKIEKMGEELKDTVEVDVEIGKALTPRIVTTYANKYLPPFHVEPPRDNFIHLRATWDGTESNELRKGMPYHAIYELGSKEAALEAYSKISNETSDLGKAKEVAKMISERNKIDEAKTAQEIAQKKEAERIAQDLMAKYGA